MSYDIEQDKPRAKSEFAVSEPPIETSDTRVEEDLTAPNSPPVDDPEYVPMNQVELAAAASKIGRRIDIDQIAAFYHNLKRLETAANKDKLTLKKNECIMKKSTLAEEKIRKAIRRILEITPTGLGLSFSSMDTETGDGSKSWKQSNAKKVITVGDVGGEQLEELAAEFGFASPRGVSGWIERIFLKARYLLDLKEQDPTEFDRLLLMGVAEYIEYLKSSGELDEEEIEFLYKYPQHVAELDGFREFISPIIKRGQKEKLRTFELEEEIIATEEENEEIIDSAVETALYAKGAMKPRDAIIWAIRKAIASDPDVLYDFNDLLQRALARYDA